MNRNGPLSDYYRKQYLSALLIPSGGLKSLENPNKVIPQQIQQDPQPQYIPPTQNDDVSEPVNIPARRTQNKVDCQNCGKTVQIASMSRHLKSKRCMEASSNESQSDNSYQSYPPIDPFLMEQNNSSRGSVKRRNNNNNQNRRLLDLTGLSNPIDQVNQSNNYASQTNYDDSVYEADYDLAYHEQTLDDQEDEEDHIQLEY